MDKLIEDYEMELAEPGCSIGTGRYGVLVTLSNDISAVFPYLNAVLPKAIYDHENKVLTWLELERSFALRPYEIRVSRVHDREHARQVVREIIERTNRVWQERETITPRFTEKKPLPVMVVFKLLPRTNCRQCGYATCMAYAAALSQGGAKPEQCPPLSPAAKTRLEELISQN